jgi:hypothetical protein
VNLTAGLRGEIDRVLKSIASAADEEMSTARDFSRAEALVKLLKDLNELDDATVMKFVEAGKFDEIAAALAVLSDVPTELIARLLEGPRSDLVLIPCKSAGLSWPVVEPILRTRPLKQPISDQALKLARRDYGKLSAETAQRTMRFWRIHHRIAK